MNFNLTHTDFLSSGIFGNLTSQDQSLTLFTLERAFPHYPDGPMGSTIWKPKLVPGYYTCRRRLSPHFGYDVFEVLDVPGCSFIELHRGNTEIDSEGCVLLGLAREGDYVIHSAAAFNIFMEIQQAVDKFELIVT